jgi:hypothetical protein
MEVFSTLVISQKYRSTPLQQRGEGIQNRQYIL